MAEGMRIHGEKITVSTKGFSDVRNITDQVQQVVAKAGITEGIASVFVIGSTASVTTIEFEPNLVEDFQDHLEQLASQKKKTRHGETWGDDNGFSHIRATLMGPGNTVPVAGSDLVLGTWQQIVLIDHDNRSRHREVFVQVIGL
jgi:secondary thiamine-phosphate synthase enzyme